MSGAVLDTKAAPSAIQQHFLDRAMGGRFVVRPHEVNTATKEELRRLTREGKLVFAAGGWVAAT